MLVVKFSLVHIFLPAKMDVWGWLCWVFKYIVSAVEVFIEFVAEYAFLIMLPSLSWMWFVAKLDLRSVRSDLS